MSEETVKMIVRETIAELKKTSPNGFYINEEDHYNQHKFIKSLMDWTNSCSSAVGKTIAVSVVTGILGLLVCGFIFWGSKSFK